VTKREKLAGQVKKGKQISPEDAQTLLKQLGYEIKGTKGSHQTWSNGKNKITILLNKKELPFYLIDQMKQILEEEGL
jgi:predicted RNA binding protein YcfA (HicA-like mRNA interferase family)